MIFFIFSISLIFLSFFVIVNVFKLITIHLHGTEQSFLCALMFTDVYNSLNTPFRVFVIFLALIDLILVCSFHLIDPDFLNDDWLLVLPYDWPFDWPFDYPINGSLVFCIWSLVWPLVWIHIIFFIMLCFSKENPLPIDPLYSGSKVDILSAYVEWENVPCEILCSAFIHMQNNRRYNKEISDDFTQQFLERITKRILGVRFFVFMGYDDEHNLCFSNSVNNKHITLGFRMYQRRCTPRGVITRLTMWKDRKQEINYEINFTGLINSYMMRAFVNAIEEIEQEA